MVDQGREARKIPVRKVSSAEMRAELDERIQVFEQRYELSSENMAVALSAGAVRETAELVEWMQVHQTRQYLREKDAAAGIPAPVPESKPVKTENQVNPKREPRKIPVRKVTAEEMRGELEASVSMYELRYEMSSANMLQCISMGVVRETGDILKWMFDYHVLQRILAKETPTDGTLGITT